MAGGYVELRRRTTIFSCITLEVDANSSGAGLRRLQVDFGYDDIRADEQVTLPPRSHLVRQKSVKGRLSSTGLVKSKVCTRARNGRCSWVVSLVLEGYTERRRSSNDPEDVMYWYRRDTVK